jgi:hypothetical protein
MKGKDLMGTISPLYGAITGHGAFGGGGQGALGLLGGLGDKKKKNPVSEEVAADVANAGVAKFSKGGRIDGCAIRGMTKGKKL